MAKQTLHVTPHSRTIRERDVTFGCAWCSRTVTEARFPGPLPTYCRACKGEAERFRAVLRQRRRRARLHGETLDEAAEEARFRAASRVGDPHVPQ